MKNITILPVASILAFESLIGPAFPTPITLVDGPYLKLLGGRL
jgi:hypothetical protein